MAIIAAMVYSALDFNCFQVEFRIVEVMFTIASMQDLALRREISSG